jgi:hypothetical protein
MAALFPRMGQPHKPAEIVGSGEAPAADVAPPAPSPTLVQGALAQADADGPLSATITNLDFSRAKRAAAPQVQASAS